MKKPYFLYIIDGAGICLFSYNFKQDIEIFPSDIFSGFITAISIFSAELNENLGFTEQEGRLPAIPLSLDFEIMISYVNPFIGVLVVEKKDIDQDMKDFLNAFLPIFLKKYEKELERWNGNLRIFETFKEEIEKIFKKMELFSFQIPRMKEISTDKNILYENENYVTIIKEIDGKKSIKEISEKSGKSMDETKTMISNLFWSELITLSEKVYEDDIFEPKRDLFYLLRTEELDPEHTSSNLSEQELLEHKLLSAIDGFKTVSNIEAEFPNLTLYETKLIISYYFSKGLYFEKIELFPQIIKISEDFFEKMTTQDLALSFSLENMCDGESSLANLSKKTGFPLKDIKRILDLLGNQVFYKKKYVK